MKLTGGRFATLGLAIALMLGATTARAVASEESSPAVTAMGDAAPVSPWLALAALSNQVETPERLCYWNFRDEHWIPADTARAAELISEDSRPVFREAGYGPNRCRGGVPAADVATLGAVLSAFIYIATEDEDGSFRRESISPS